MNRIAVIGVGNVGMAFAYAAAIKRLANDIVLIDANAARAEGESMDLADAMALVGPVQIRSGGYEQCEGARIVVVTAGAKQMPGQSRLDLVRVNAGITRDILTAVMQYADDPLYIMATNPVDVLTHVARTVTGVAPGRVIGSGTVLDSARFRGHVAEILGVDVRGVHAHIVGEHGDSEVALWSRANVSGIPVAEMCARRGIAYDAAFREKALGHVRHAAYEIIGRKGATGYGIGMSLCRIVEAILHDEHSVLTVSCPVAGHYGLGDVSLSLSCVIGSDGIEEVLDAPIAEDEQAALAASARVLGEHLAAL